jgi:hypothetical protein
MSVFGARALVVEDDPHDAGVDAVLVTPLRRQDLVRALRCAGLRPRGDVA